MTDEGIGLFEAIYSQRAIRSFQTRPIPREDITKIIEAATKLPSGGNAQPWAFIVLKDKDKMAEMAKFARHGFDELSKVVNPDLLARLKPMFDAFEQIPCLIIVCSVNSPSGPGAGNGSSIFPAVQNLLLAARGLGIGAALTTGWASLDLDGIRALLQLPENVEPMAYIPMGYPDKERYGTTSRRPWSEVTHWDGWEGEKENSANPTLR